MRNFALYITAGISLKMNFSQESQGQSRMNIQGNIYDYQVDQWEEISPFTGITTQNSFCSGENVRQLGVCVCIDIIEIVL